jgi:isocitrate dehydrogenase
MGYQKIKVPADGDKITVNADLSLNVPNHPIIPFIEGDGIGARHHPGDDQGRNAAVEQGLWHQARHFVDGNLLR